MAPNTNRILVIDDDPIMGDACRETLTRKGHEVEVATDGATGLALLNRYVYDVVLLDLRMPDTDGLTVLRQLREQDPESVVIVISGHGSIESAVEAMKLGAFDFVPKPFTPAELRASVDKALEKRRLLMENAYLKAELKRKSAPIRLIHQSASMARVMDVVRRVAATDTTVLLTGESGTGKGLVARIIHELSPRRERPFVSVDCSTLVPTLFESELFGHVKGAYTGAEGNTVGKFELSNGGTLFFDEVGNISWEIQSKLLKAVEERAISKVGSNRVIRVDTRLVAATNQNLQEAVKRGAFRKDLFYRLNVVHVDLPALRDRPEDVPLLANYFLERLRHLSGGRVKAFTPAALTAMSRYSWPGNVRELINAVQRLVVLAAGETIDPEDLEAMGTMGPDAPQEEDASLAEMESRHILNTLKRLGGRRSEAARALGIDRKTLRLKIRKYNLEQKLEGGAA